jgi:hypothetical protein
MDIPLAKPAGIIEIGSSVSLAISDVFNVVTVPGNVSHFNLITQAVGDKAPHERLPFWW